MALEGSNTAQIQINVDRNLHPPVISNLDNTKEIFHNTTGQVYDVAASDTDTTVSNNYTRTENWGTHL